jgi:hypothetical protein
MPRPKITKVLTGSELNGADQNIAGWAGLDVPDDKWDEYVDLVGGVSPLAEFFENIENGTFEVTETEDDMGPGMNDTYWEVTTSSVEALRAEVRQRLVEQLDLKPAENPVEPEPVAPKKKAQKTNRK